MSSDVIKSVESVPSVGLIVDVLTRIRDDVAALTPDMQAVGRIETAPQAEDVARLLARASAALKQCHEWRTDLTRPIDALKTIILSTANASTDQLSDEMARLKRETSEYLRREREAADRMRREVEAEQRAKEQKLRAEAERAALKGRQEVAAKKLEQAEVVASSPPPMVIPPRPPQNVGTTENWRFEIVDAALIPREFLIPDEKLLAKLAKAMRERASVAGVRFFRGEDRVTVRQPR